MSPHEAETNLATTSTDKAPTDETLNNDGVEKMTPPPHCHRYIHDDITEKEKNDVEVILKELTKEEMDAVPDDHMPLRHLRAEKVRLHDNRK